MSKPKYSAELKIHIAKAYLFGEGSYESLSAEYKVGFPTLRRWVAKYREQGEAGFVPHSGNSAYSSEFKIKCVEAVLRGEEGVDVISAKYNISDGCVLRRWIRRYNANKELKDYDPKREVYMADARRKKRWKSEKRLLSTALPTTKIIREQLRFMVFPIARYTLG